VAGVGAALAHAYLHPASEVPTVGASGAISGVLGAYLVLFPFARVATLVPIVFFFVHVVEVPAVLYLGIWLMLQVVSGTLAMAAGAAGGVGLVGARRRLRAGRGPGPAGPSPMELPAPMAGGVGAVVNDRLRQGEIHGHR
jgi:membrane associated rhomboid family serine protease